jgi:hypothetical protein
VVVVEGMKSVSDEGRGECDEELTTEEIEI